MPTPQSNSHVSRLPSFSRELLDDLRRRLPEYATALGVSLKPSGSRLIGQCPLHDDKNPSFAIYGEDLSKWGCYPCDAGGDVFDLCRALGKVVTFPEAVADVAAVLGVSLHDGSQPHRDNGRGHKSPAPTLKLRGMTAKVALTDEQKFTLLASRYAFRDVLRKDYRWRDRIVKELGIPIEALNRAARGHSGLGIYYGLIAYVYPTGIKVRNPPGSKCRFIWEMGKALAPWRYERVGADTHTVYVTEGESDALALLACGVEKDRHAAVVACPGKGFPEAWGELFTGKEVVLWFDFDDAGQDGMRRAAEIISRHAVSVKIVRK